MSTTLKAVASFNDAGWAPVKHVSAFDPESTALSVLRAWNNHETVEGCGLGFDDLTTGIEWQRVDEVTMAYRICGKVLLIVGWEYDYCSDGGESWGIGDWHMGTEAQQ